MALFGHCPLIISIEHLLFLRHHARCQRYRIVMLLLGFPDGSNSKESTCNVRDPGSIPGSGRSSGGRHGNPLQYSCRKNPMDRGAWWATVHWVVVACGLWDLSFPTRDQTHVLCIVMQILYHLTTKEVPVTDILTVNN